MAAGYLDLLTSTARGTIADDAGFDLTNDAEWRYDIAPDDWTPAAITYIADRWLTTGGFRSWRMQINTGASLLFSVEDGLGAFRETVTQSFNKPADGERCQLRFRLDADNGSSQTVVTLHSRRGSFIQDLESDSDWALEDTDTLGGGVQTWKASTSLIALHNQSEGTGAVGFVGRYYRAVMWTDLTKTTKAFDVNFGDNANQVSSPAVWNDAARTGDWTFTTTVGTDFMWEADPTGAGGGFGSIMESPIMALPAASTTNATATPATVNAPAAVPAATKTASVEKTATTVNAIAAVPLATTVGGTTVLPATINLITAVPAVTKTASVDKTAITVNAPAAVLAATTSASVEKTAVTVNAVAAVPASTRTASVEKATTTVSAVVSIPASTRTASVEKAATTVNLVAAIPNSTRTASVEKTATPVPAVAFVPQAAASGSGEATVIPNPVNAVASIPLVVVSAGTTKQAVTVNLLVVIPTPTRTATATFAAVTINLVAGIPFVTVSNGGPAIIYDLAPGGGTVNLTEPGVSLVGVEAGGGPTGIEGG